MFIITRYYEVIGTKVQPVYTSKKIGNDLAVSEAKPPLVNKQNVVYKFQCDLHVRRGLYRIHEPSFAPTHR